MLSRYRSIPGYICEFARILKNIRVNSQTHFIDKKGTGKQLVTYLRADRAELHERVNAVLNWIVNGMLKIHIDKIFPLAEVDEAHRYLEDRQSKGKILLVP